MAHCGSNEVLIVGGVACKSAVLHSQFVPLSASAVCASCCVSLIVGLSHLYTLLNYVHPVVTISSRFCHSFHTVAGFSEIALNTNIISACGV